MQLDKIKNALLTIGVPVSHYTAVKKPDRYIVWAEDGQAEPAWADDRLIGQVIQGTVDYFTRTERDQNTSRIQNAMNEAEISFSLNSVQREDETGYIHYEWVWEVFSDG